MKKFLTIKVVTIGIILTGIATLVVTFLFEMNPTKDKEVEAIKQAEQYLEEQFNDHFEIFDPLYNNMGYFNFAYAAKVREKNTNTEFLVYFDDDTNQMLDTYIANKWENDLENEISSIIKDKFGETSEILVDFTNDTIGKELRIDPLQPKSYKDFNVAPTIQITVPRKANKEDEQSLNEVIAFLKSEKILRHGTVAMNYIDKGIILDYEWFKYF